VLRVVYRSISHYLIGKADHTRTTGHTSAVTLLQRFGSPQTPSPARWMT